MTILEITQQYLDIVDGRLLNMKYLDDADVYSLEYVDGNENYNTVLVCDANGEVQIRSTENQVLYRFNPTSQHLELYYSDQHMIRVYPFHNAPSTLRVLSEHGGDEDWLAIAPASMAQPAWMEDGTPFGCCDVSVHQHPTDKNLVVYIGAHA